MTSLEYLKGYKAALRHLIDFAEHVDKYRNKTGKVVAKNTAAYLKLCYEHADRLADGYSIDLWITPDGKLFFKDV